MNTLQTITVPLSVTSRLDPEDIKLIALAVAAELRAVPPASTVPQFAKRYNKTPSWAYRKIKLGKIKATPMGGDGDLTISAAEEVRFLAGGE